MKKSRLMRRLGVQPNEGSNIGRTRGQTGESGGGLGQFQRHIYLLSIMGLCGLKCFPLDPSFLDRDILNIKRVSYNFFQYHSGFQCHRGKINLTV